MSLQCDRAEAADGPNLPPVIYEGVTSDGSPMYTSRNLR